MKKRSILLALVMLLFFIAAVTRLEVGRQAHGKTQLEEAVRRAVAACYAVEGFYPPSLDYIQDHYALEYDESSYMIRYDVFASNLMPDITILEK